MRRGGIPAAKTFQQAAGGDNPNATGASGFTNQAGATAQSQARQGLGDGQDPATNNFFGGAAADGTQMINTMQKSNALGLNETNGSRASKRPPGTANSGFGS